MADFKFNVGDRVLVRPDFTKDDANGAGYISQMEAFRGKIVTIQDRTTRLNGAFNAYRFNKEEDEMQWLWGEAQLAYPYQTEQELFEALVHGYISDKEYEALKNTLSK